MISEGSLDTSAVVLDRHLLLLEYDTASDATQAAALFQRRKSLEPYLARHFLVLGFDGDEPRLRATHYVGLLPFSDAGKEHLLLIAPKGCREEEKLGMVRFLELLALAEGETPLEEVPGWQGQLGPHQYLLFLAHHYARLLQELCRRDFRSYYRHEEAELRGAIRGRLHLAGYARFALRGKQHLLPCRWDEFTVDNWDNRILWAAARRLKQVAAAALGSEAAALVWRPFQSLSSWFSTVSEEEIIRTSDFRNSRLGRTSRYYRQALAWARLLLQGSDLPTATGQVPPLVLDTHCAFEKFAEAVASAALPDATWRAFFQEEWPFLSGQQVQRHQPDIFLTSSLGINAIGDAKYKEVLERAPASALASGKEIQACIQAGDWNQLYVYMRMKKAHCGFFVVPFWKADGQLIEWLDEFDFAVRPLDSSVRVAVLALNLLRPLKDVRQKAAKQLCDWLSVHASTGMP